MRIFGHGTPTRYQALRDDGWLDARDERDVGELTARWVTREITFHPGYGSPRDPYPDLETDAIADHMARLNRAGFVTVNSQPGRFIYREPGEEDRVYEQNAYVGALVHPDAARRLFDDRATLSDEVDVAVQPAAARRAWRRGTSGLSHADVALIFDGLDPRCVDRMQELTYVEIADQVSGRDDILWPGLHAIVDGDAHDSDADDADFDC